MNPRDFWAQVDFPLDPDDCWLWRGRLNGGGYGTATIDGVTAGAYRHAYLMLRGDIAPRLMLDHLCRVRACVNPTHLEVVTHAENMRRAVPFMPRGVTHYLGRRTHCKWGHPYDEENTVWTSEGRDCRICRVERPLRRKQRVVA